MFAGRLTQATLRVLDWLAQRTLKPEDAPAHQRTGRRGEEDAYFYLRRRGYTIIARNYRSPNHRGELDLVGWVRDTDGEDVLCFIEVKTRTTRAIKPPGRHQARRGPRRPRQRRRPAPRRLGLPSPHARIVRPGHQARASFAR